MWFSQTNRKMIDEMANLVTRIRRYVERYGEETVEQFLDSALSLESLIDYHSVYSPGRQRSRYDFSGKEEAQKEVRRFRSKGYR